MIRFTKKEKRKFQEIEFFYYDKYDYYYYW